MACTSIHPVTARAIRHSGIRRSDKLNRCHRAANRFKTGSRRWRKFRQRAAKMERHVVNQRKDWQYKQAHALAQQYDAVCVETLDLAGMMQNEPAFILRQVVRLMHRLRFISGWNRSLTRRESVSSG